MRKRITLALLSLLLVPLAMMAQNVTVHPGDGSMLPAKKFTDNSNGDIFFRWRGFATWKHEQLSLTMTTGDSDNNVTDASNQLTSNGQLQNPANNLFATPSNTTGAARYLQIGKGGSNMVMDTYVTVVLPKGYRFTGYSITFHRIPYPTADGITYMTSGSYQGQIRWTNDNNGYSYSELNATTASISFGETDKSFAYKSGNYVGGITTDDEEEHTISRTGSDMTNVLYFKLSAGNNTGRAFIQLDNMDLQFTAENNTPTLVPPTIVTERSAVEIPFTTGKVDYDQLTNRTDGVTRISYNGVIRDMNANMTIYEEGSVKTITAAENDFDGTAGKIVEDKSGSISQVGDYLKLDPSKHNSLTADGEAIYYIESPTWATNSAATNAHKNPIGYRIVGATFNYGAGTGEDVYFPATFKIQYNSTNNGPDQNGTYGLNVYSGTYNWNSSYHTVWRIDKDGYIYGYGDGDIYYLAINGTDISMTTTKPGATSTFTITNNQIRTKNQINGSYYYIGWKETRATNSNGSFITYTASGGTNYRVTRSFVITTSASGNTNSVERIGISTYVQQSAASTTALGGYTLKIYKPDGVGVEKTINVTNQSSSVTVSGYNNDAIKIGIISNATNGGPGLINGKITMQALDPYIDRLDIVCQESGGTGGKLTQQFSATDFAVKGGQFTFYVPEGFPAPAKFTFENLYSHYGDETYYGETSSTNHARYFFVKSPYHQTNANVYDRNNEASYTTKILTEKVGNTKFTFNNASTVSSTGGYFEENAFNPNNYSSFIDFTFSQTEMTNGTVKTAYLFTCDEPRYNIAPTTATQHVYYAFYEMKIDMQTKTYTPVLAWQKIYDSSFDGGGKTDSKWGLTLTTTETVDDHGRHSGYLTVTQIKDQIAARTGDNTVTGGPKNTDQILFVDGSNLMSIVENQTSTGTGSNITYTSHPKSELKAELDKNALIYLPYGSKSSDDNFAFNTIEDYTKTPIFRGANDIVITDKYGFYAPYDIQVDAAKSASYTRQITKSTYKDEAYATVIMPFEIELTNGQHVDDYGTLEFLQMNTENATSDKYYNYGPTVFFSKTTAAKVAANTPYALHATQSGVENGVFIVDQPGAKIVATPDAAKSANSLFSATTITSTGNLTDKDGNTSQYTFSHKGSFSGFKIPKTNPKTFYFANNGFYSSAELNSNYSTVDLLPFRSVYEVTSGGSAKVGFLHFVEGENETDGIDVLKTAFELDMNAPVYDLQGRMIAPTYREVVGKNLSSGIYVVNGVKIIVK
ncbi:MAG: hypothetical protein IKX44_01870 [Prevotella sp.]|nr:hypothetical protein [Prevotella sp.]